ncbi:MAG: hypothetical protein ACRER2_12135 [Methylococcales bacterium]
MSDFLRRWFSENIPPLRLTVHAGEEFIHLLGGLRRIKSRWQLDQVIEYHRSPLQHT